jgi:hypothetical protein
MYHYEIDTARGSLFSDFAFVLQEYIFFNLLCYISEGIRIIYWMACDIQSPTMMVLLCDVKCMNFCEKFLTEFNVRGI